MDFLVKNRKYIGLGGCVLTIIGCFLPFVNALGISIDYIAGDGKLLSIAMVVSAVLICLKKDKNSLISSCIGGLIFLFSAFKVLGTSGVNMGIGLIVIFIGLICVIAYPFLKKK